MKKFFIKINLFCGIILILVGLFIQYEEVLINMFIPASLNLNLSEVDTFYNNDSSIEKDLSYIPDTSWGWPAASGYYLSTYYSSGHPAIDIVPTNGDYNIYAASSGVVVTNSWKWDGGNYLIIKQDNGYYSLYCHLASKLVEQGQRVNKGDIIGLMGRTGRATGVHLHYSIWTGYPYYGGKSVIPLNFY